MKKYELIEHTADIGIKVKGKDLKELFKNAALAMFDIIAEHKTKNRVPRTHNNKKNLIIKQKADNLDELLVNWLNELLSQSAAKELIFSDFQIDKIERNLLQAVARAEDIKNYKVNKEIKAATYHELEIKESKSGWEAKIIFDV